MKKPERHDGYDWEKVRLARRRIEEGFYDEGLLEDLVEWGFLDRFVERIASCPYVSDEHPNAGNTFRDLTAMVLAASLPHVIDRPLIRIEFQSEAGRGDIDLPLRIEALGNDCVWMGWVRRYGMTSIVVEAKNMRNKAGVEEVRQLEDYLRNGSLGRMGFLVSRNGFSKNASHKIIEQAHRKECLIIPFSAKTLGGLATAAKVGPQATTKFLRRQETLLMQASA